MITLYKEKCVVSLICLGVFIFLCAPWVLSSNTPYHRLIIALFWFPTLVHVFFCFSRYKSISRVGALLYLFAAAWFSLVIVVHAQSASDLRELKVTVYVALTLLGFFAIAQENMERFVRLLLVSAVLGGFGAWGAWVFFYLVEGNSLMSRLVAYGLWDVIIPASQAVGALMLLVVCFGVKEKTRPAFAICLIVSLSGYFAFLISSQSRGVWVALFVALFVVSLFLRNRKIYVLLGVFVAALAALYVYNNDIFVGRGVSYRTEIWRGGGVYFLDNFWVGIGEARVWINIPSTDIVFSHPHNMFIDIAMRFGFVGLLSWLLLWGWAIGKAYQFRYTDIGRAALVLLVYSSVVVLTDGIAQWRKPNFGWFITWVPLALAFSLSSIKDKSLSE